MVIINRPPRSERQKSAQIMERVKEKLKEHTNDIIILGDFNLPIIKWSAGKTAQGPRGGKLLNWNTS